MKLVKYILLLVIWVGIPFLIRNLVLNIVYLLVLLILTIRVKKRGYFWKDKKGEPLTFYQFMKRWGKGVEGITPLQQTKTALVSFIPVLAGMIWGIVITFISKTYWMCLVLVGSIPLILVQVINNIQRYITQKRVEKVMKELDNGI